MSETPVTRYLDEQNISYRLFQHSGPVRSLEQAAEERGQLPEQVVRSIVFRLGENQFAMVLIAGPAQISWPGLRKHLGQNRLTMASEQEVEEQTGYKIGSVSPFGLRRPMPVLVDESVWQPQEVSIGSGQRGLAVILTTADLRKALGEVDTAVFASR